MCGAGLWEADDACDAKNVGALASQYNKIVGTEVMAKATKVMQQTEPTNGQPEIIITSEPQDPELMETSVENSTSQYFLILGNRLSRG